MRYIVTVNGERWPVDRDGELARLGDAAPRVVLEELDGTPVRLVRLDDEVYRVVVERRSGRGAYRLWIDGFRYEVEALDERARAIRDLAGPAGEPAGAARLLAPMPGLIVRVLVGTGTTVQAGQGLVVMEAMKMENELRAPAGGLVRDVLVAAGMVVEKGAVLVELESAPPGAR